MSIVLDASVLADIFITNKPRHQLANRLAKHLKETNMEVKIPYHALLEVKCAIDNERQSPGKGELCKDIFTEKSGLKVAFIPIDKSFFKNYFDLSVPYIKAGDLPYILIAKKHECSFITEDNTQYKVALKVGIPVYKIAEYLSKTNS